MKSFIITHATLIKWHNDIASATAFLFEACDNVRSQI